MALFLISFVAGILTVLAPCILPLLPVIIGSSVENGSRKRAYTVIGSLIVSIVLFTLLLKFSTAFIRVSPMIWSILSGVILIFVAISMLFPKLWEALKFINRLNLAGNKLLGQGYQKKSFWGDVVIGAALGPVFSSCSPTYFIILATVLPQSLSKGILYLFAYSLGLGLVLLLISFLGQKLVNKLGVVADPSGIFKKVIGVLFLLVGILIITGADKTIQTNLIKNGYTGLNNLEYKLLQKDEASKNVDGVDLSNSGQILSVADKMRKYNKYNEIVNPGGFVNTNGQIIKIADYVGKKVILLDFMTYSCINCQRTFPYANDWYKKYEDKGLIIIGIHTPEFAFEHDIKNVEKALGEFGIKFPVVLDNAYGTWNAYGNRYWPRKYMIDIDGYVAYDHIGEGGYDETESKIVELLNERMERLGADNKIEKQASNVQSDSLRALKNFYTNSPETYLGAARGARDSSIVGMCTNGVCEYKTQMPVPQDKFTLQGQWKKDPEYVELKSDSGSINYNFTASKVYLVADSMNGSIAEIYIDGKLIKPEESGFDVVNGAVNFKESRLYNLVDFKSSTVNRVLEIRVKGSGMKAYAFTFG